MTLETPWQIGPWPQTDQGEFALVPLELRAPQPGDLRILDQLTAAGLSWDRVEDEHGNLVAGMLMGGPVQRIWADLVRTFPTFGLWPVITAGAHWDAGSPWLERELSGHCEIPADALRVLVDHLAAPGEWPDAPAWGPTKDDVGP